MWDSDHAFWGSPNKWKNGKFSQTGIEDKVGQICCARPMDVDGTRTHDSR